MRCVALSLVLLACAGPARAQFTLSGPPSDASLRTVQVRGTGEAIGTRDRAVVHISFRSRGETAEEALGTHQAEIDRIQALLTAAGIPADQVFLDRSTVGSNPGRGGMMGGEEDGFSASRELTVQVDDLDRVPLLVASLASDQGDDLLAVTQRQINVSYVVRDSDVLYRQALRDAVADARQRATLIAREAGLTLDRVLSVTEDGAGGTFLDAMSAGMRANALAGALEGGDGEYRVEVGVSVTFAIR